MKKSYLLFYSLLLLIPLGSRAQALNQRVVVNGLNTPWEILWGPDNMIWMTEREGTVSRIEPGSGHRQELLRLINVAQTSESGLLGMELDPDFNRNQYVYLAYNYRFTSDVYLRISRFTFVRDTTETERDTLRDEKILLDNIAGNGNHNGSRLAFGPDGKLYVSTGDAQNTTLPQDTTALNGKILRLNADGTVPSDNPWPGSYVWAYGLRNTQGLVWVGGRLYGSEHGPNAHDELNLLTARRNYGWPEVNGFCDQQQEIDFCNAHNVMEPLVDWDSIVAPAGLDYYGNGPIAAWQHTLLLTTLKGSRLIRIQLNENGDSVLSIQDSLITGYGRLRDLCISPEGKVYIATSNRDGRGTDIDSADDRIIEISAEESGIRAQTGLPGFTIYPNPASNHIVLQGLPQQAAIEVRDLMGRAVYKTTGSGRTDILTTAWTPGAYIIILRWDGGSAVRKVLIAR